MRAIPGRVERSICRAGSIIAGVEVPVAPGTITDATADARDLVAYIKSLWTPRELDCQGPKHMECMQ